MRSRCFSDGLTIDVSAKSGDVDVDGVERERAMGPDGSNVFLGEGLLGCVRRRDRLTGQRRSWKESRSQRDVWKDGNNAKWCRTARSTGRGMESKARWTRTCSGVAALAEC